MIRRLYWKWIAWRFGVERHLTSRTRAIHNAVVLQIGSNDGFSGDPLHRLILANPGWQATFVEPMPALFEQLKKNYGDDPRFTFVNAAVSQSNGTLELFYIDTPALRQRGESLPSWLDQLATTDRPSLERCEGGRFKEYIRSRTVECLDGPTLLQQTGLENVDILHVDTEGHDWIILQTLFASGINPAIVLVEHVCLNKDDKNTMRNFLTRKYKVRDLGRDFLCVRS